MINIAVFGLGHSMDGLLLYLISLRVKYIEIQIYLKGKLLQSKGYAFYHFCNFVIILKY